MARQRKEPGHPLSYPNDTWTCPTTAVAVPKDPIANALMREQLARAGDLDPEKAAQICLLCHQSFLVWVNLFGWTYRILEHRASGTVESTSSFDVPFVTWPCQDAAAAEIERARRDGQPIAIEKSRDMGASWLCIAYIVWDCLFPRPGKSGNWLMISTKEEDVYKVGSKKALFSKIEYMLKKLPGWMKPKYTMVERLITFRHDDSGPIIQGSSTNSFVGVGDRTTGLFIDEASTIDILQRIETETSDTGPFRIFNSTNRAGSYYTSHLLPSGRVRIVNLAWWDHPEKGRGRSLTTDPKTGGLRYTSPWYETQKKRRSAKDVAQNLDMDRMGAGTGVFDSRVLARQKSMYCDGPISFGEIGLPDGTEIDRDVSLTRWPVDRLCWLERAEQSARWRWFGELIPDGGRARPAQDFAYAMGCDVSMGRGASPSVISVVNVDTGWKIGRFLCTNTSPDALADEIYLAGHWIGGRTGVPLVVVESNGPGGNTLQRLVRLSYPSIFRRPQPGVRVSDEPTTQLGWHSDRVSKPRLLEQYNASLDKDLFRNPDAEALDEHGTYLHYDRGGVGPSLLADRTPEERDRHGDMTIADALADLARLQVPRKRIDDHAPAYGSAGWRRKRMSERQADIRRQLQR